MNPLDFHSLDDEDTYILISKAKGEDAVTVHIHGDRDELADLLEAGFQAIDDDLEQVTHH